MSLKTAKEFDDLAADLELLSSLVVLVGVPEETSDRGEVITNAVLAYIHDNGAPESNIPARPFMTPGIDRAKQRTQHYLEQTAKDVLRSMSNDRIDLVYKGLTKVGLLNQAAIRLTITEGIPPPLADSTLRARLRRFNGRSGEREELDRRKAARKINPLYAGGTDLAKPLIDTGELRNSINFVIRKKL